MASIDEILCLAASVASIATAIVIIISTLYPIYTFEGSMEGYVGFRSFNITILGREVHSEFFDSLSVYIISTYTAMFILLGSAIVTIVSRCKLWARELLLGSAAGAMVASGVIAGLIASIYLELNRLKPPASLKTSAGLVSYPPTTIHLTVTGQFLELSPLLVVVPLVLSLLTVSYQYMSQIGVRLNRLMHKFREKLISLLWRSKKSP